MPKAIVTISGKGGVGKSLVTASIIQTLKDKGKKVAAVDADTDNPHLADFLNIKGEIKTEVKGKDRLLIPAEKDGIKIFSMSLIAPDSPIGLVGSTSGDLINDVIHFTKWGDVDYFCVDLPAGSGDEMRVSFTALSEILAGCILVAQPAHILSAERVLKLLKINEIPILGIIENMAYFEEKDGDKNYLFGEPGGEALATKYNAPFLGHIPIVPVNLKEGGKRIPEQWAQPIEKAVQLAEESPVKPPGFIARSLGKAKEITISILGQMLVDLWRYANKEIPINDLQTQYSYPGGRLIRMNLLSDAGKIIASEHYKVEGGKLVWIQRTQSNKDQINEELERTGVRLYARVRALAEAFVGERVLSDGTRVAYDLKTAWLNNEVIPVGKAGDMIGTIEFIMGVWEYVKARKPPFMLEFAKRFL